MREKKTKSSYFEIDFLGLVKMLWRSAIWILLGAVIVAAAVFAGTKLLATPTYQSKFTAYVNNKSESTTTLSSSDLSASQYLTNTFAEIINSYSLLEAAAEKANIPFEYNSLRSAVSVNIASNTQIMTIRVILTDPNSAYEMAKALMELAPSYSTEIVEGSSMKIIDHPRKPTSPYGPKSLNNAIIGFAIGLLGMCLIMIIRFFSDTTIKSQSELEEAFDLPVLGVIPDVKSARKTHGRYGDYGSTDRHQGE